MTAKKTTTTTTGSIPAHIRLLPAEHLLRTLLLDCRDYVLAHSTQKDGDNDHLEGSGSQGQGQGQVIEIWFVGGWVRDKLLGLESADIDVALSSMTGSEFASHLKDFLSSPAQPPSSPSTENKANLDCCHKGDDAPSSSSVVKVTKGDYYKEEATKLGIPSVIRGFYDIDRKPEKGKHLQTSSANILGLDIDFVNLRGDTAAATASISAEGMSAASQSRQKFDSLPQEDAYRRDATINAIFFNLDKQEIQDFTGKGLDDLKSKTLRTPLDPRITFTDDPLRILRLVRFASTRNFDIDKTKTQQAMSDPAIQSLIRSRVSPERVGSELQKMITGPAPAIALQWIHTLKLYKPVLLGEQTAEVMKRLQDIEKSESANWKPHSKDEEEYVWPLAWPDTCRLVSELISSNVKDTSRKRIADELVLFHNPDLELVWQMVVWCPLGILVQSKDSSPPPSQVLKPAVKAIRSSNEKTRLLETSMNNMHDIRATIDLVVDTDTSRNRNTLRRGHVGIAIRSWGKTWRLQVLFTLLTDLLASIPTQQKTTTEALPLIKRYSTFLQFVVDQKLQDAPAVKQILTGADIKTIFGLQRSGPFMTEVIHALLAWQFDTENDGKDHEDIKAQAIEWLRNHKDQLNIPNGTIDLTEQK